MTQRTTSDAQVASTGAFLPDSWSCWEGSIILSTGKETFEVLGLPGAKLSARMPGAPDQHRMPTFHDLYYFFNPDPPPASDQRLAEHTGREHERSKPRFHPRFVHTVGSIARKIWPRAVGFCVSRLSSWCVDQYESRAVLVGLVCVCERLIRFRRQSDGSAFALACPASSSQARRPKPPKCLHPDLCSAPASESTPNLFRAQGTP